MSDAAEWLTRLLDRREVVAKAAAERGGPHWPDSPGEQMKPTLVHARAHDPAWALADIAAKRAIVEAYQKDVFFDGWIIRALAKAEGWTGE